jgi:hypothetical protein
MSKFKLTSKQKEALKLLTNHSLEFLGYGGGAGGGKTYLGCFWLMQLGYYAPGTKYFIGRDSLKDTRESVLHTWRKLSKDIGFTQWKYADNHIYFSNGSEIEFLDLTFYPQKDPLFERFGSKEYTAGWIEEAAPVNYMAFEVLKTRIGRWLNKEFNIKKKILCTFNPRKTWVDTTFFRPFKHGKETEQSKFVFALAKDNPHLPEDYITTLENLKDKATQERLLFGNFDYDDDPTSLIGFEKIEAIFENDFKYPKPNYIVADIARYGSDSTVITVWRGLSLIEYYESDKTSTVEIQNVINAFKQKYKVSVNNIIADEDGVGGGVVDTLHIKGFINNSKPPNKNYKNLKDMCGYLLSEKITEISINCDFGEVTKEKVKQELGMLKTFDADKDNKLRILPKAKIKENLGRSPDWLDVFIMRMYFFAKKKSAWSYN